MKRALIIAILLALVAAGWTWDDGASAATHPVYILNQSEVLPTSQLENALPAFQAAVDEDFAPAWGQDARLVLSDTPPADGWTISVSDESDIPGAVGYHDFDGLHVYGRVFVATALNYEMSWQSVLTHELFELLADPYIDRFAKGSRMWLVEVADPVEDDAFNYARTAADGSLVPISDFVFPSWYQKKGRPPFDAAQRVDRPQQILLGGYASYWDRGWRQIFK